MPDERNFDKTYVWLCAVITVSDGGCQQSDEQV